MESLPVKRVALFYARSAKRKKHDSALKLSFHPPAKQGISRKTMISASYRPHLKICGVTNTRDARLVGKSGADYCGILVDVGFSERSLSLEAAEGVAKASGIPTVVLMCDPEVESVLKVDRRIRPHAVQLLCSEPPDFLADLKKRVACEIWKTIHLASGGSRISFEAYIEAGADALLIDSMDTKEGFVRFGGTGKLADWKAAAAVVEKSPAPVFLAGGIDPFNVADALMEVRPAGIDLCSGVEASKGIKDPDKVSDLVRNFQAAAARIEASQRP